MKVCFDCGAMVLDGEPCPLCAKGVPSPVEVKEELKRYQRQLRKLLDEMFPFQDPRESAD